MKLHIRELRRIIREEIEGVRANSGIDRIAIFDFDGTLFRSPEKPPWWPYEGFWGRIETLSPPYVPQSPGPEWYVDSAVSDALDATSDPRTYSCLLTGRIPKFSERVKEILDVAGISFQDYFFASGGSTLPFKIKIIEEVIQKNPGVRIVEMWEDRDEHIGPFEQKLSEMGVQFKVHHIRSTPQDFLPGSENILPSSKKKR
jgi:hypothetical protein